MTALMTALGTDLVMVRHGPTAWNREKRAQGRTDVPLDEDGRREVATWSLPARFQAFTRVVSPLTRTRETMELLLGPGARPEPRIIEMDWGEWEGEQAEVLRARLGMAMTDNENRGLDFQPPGGESPRDVQRRAQQWLLQLTKPTVAVTHLGVIRAVYALATGWDMTGQAPDGKIRHATAHHFMIEAGHPRLLELNIPLERPC